MRRAGGQAGFILIATLTVLALLAGIVGGATLLTRSALEGVRADGERLKRDTLVRAGVELAAYQLLTLRLPPGEIVGEFRLDEGTVRIAARSESGRIDLNWSEPALLAAAAAAARLRSLSPAAFAQAVIAWRTRNEPRAQAAARPSATSGASAFKRDGFRVVDDLRWLPGLTGEEVAALSDLVTVHNPSGKVNVLAAPDAVLFALPGATQQAVATAVAFRSQSPGQFVVQASRLFDARHAYVSTSPGNAFSVQVEARRGSLSVATASLVLIRSPSDEAPFLTTEWHEGLSGQRNVVVP